MIRKMHDMGVRAEHAYFAGMASVVASIVAWATSRSTEKTTARADRWGIFVGLWAPTFIGIGNALGRYETEAKVTERMKGMADRQVRTEHAVGAQRS